ncbi:MAG: DUF4384 domain-containing protein, partial [Acetobacteraceae bacterium]|nr:DUF4384 domain-containing protein [Acetobacteraceae bacterium]
RTAPAASPAAPAPSPQAARKPPVGLILGAGGGLAVAAVAAWLVLGQGGGDGRAIETAEQRQEQIRRDAELRAREDADRLQRQAAQEQQQREAAARQDAERLGGQAQQQTQSQPPGPDAAAEADRRRQIEAQQAAEADRRRQIEAQQEAAAQAAAEAERRRQAEAQQAVAAQAAAEAERRRLSEAQQSAAAAEADRRRQAEDQVAAERRRQQEQEAQLRARAELRSAAAAAAAEPCSLLSWSVTDDRATISGIIRRGGEAAVQQAFTSRGVPAGAVSLQLQSFEGPYCEALDAIRPVAALFAEAPPRARVLGTAPLARGELLRLSVEMPDYQSQLYVSYFMKSGEVAHLVPSRTEPARARVALGDPAPGFPGWEVDEPFGTDLVVIFASERPIFPQRRPVVEQQADYLAALAARLRALQGQGARVTARVLPVETVAKR